MSAALKLEPRPPKWSVQDYLEAEKNSEVRHEYVGGDLYAMAGASEEHNFISLNIASALRAHLRGKPCKVFIHDMKAHVFANLTLFYYPDVMVACDPSDDDRYYKTKPRIIVEVVSESSRGTDTREKFITFIQLPSLEEYVLVEQGSMTVTVHRRSNEWIPDILTGADALLELSSIGFSMPLSLIYEGVLPKA
ncbi:MAG TPA: Uma2 family endonuclease [Prosthecobacter sp.]